MFVECGPMVILLDLNQCCSQWKFLGHPENHSSDTREDGPRLFRVVQHENIEKKNEHFDNYVIGHGL